LILEACLALVERGASDEDGQALLFACVEAGDYDMAKLLLERGLRIQEIPESESLDMTKLLLENDAEIMDIPAFQHFAIVNGQTELFEFLVEKYGRAIPEGDFGNVVSQILHGGRSGWRKENGHINSLVFLVTKYWKDPNLTIPLPSPRGKKGKRTNVLQLACGGVYLVAIKTLLELGAEVDCPGLPETAMAHMFEQRKMQWRDPKIIPVAELLLDAGVDVDGKKKNPNERGVLTKTPVEHVVERGDLEVVEFLAKKGADLNVADPPLLRTARERGFSQVANVLVSYGAIDAVF
jgi:ankyrin repeat protein